MNKGLLITVDGIDGSGKDTIAQAMLTDLERSGKHIFDLDDWSKEHGRIPFPENADRADVIFFSEPSYVWIGGAIRYELIRSGTDYSAHTVARAFSTDRLILFKRFVMPLRAEGKLIIQQRHVGSSLIYQPIQKEPLSLEEVMQLPGNALELQEAPNALIIASCDPGTALERSTGRKNKKDDSIFEKLDILTKLHERYHADWYKKLWQERGTVVHYLDANQPMADMKTEATSLARSIIQTHQQS